MLRGKPVGNGECANTGRAACFTNQTTMAQNRPGPIAATMQKQQDAGRITPGNDRPFSWYSADIDLGELDVFGYRPMRTNLVEALAPLGPSDGSWLGTQERANGVDFALNHFFCSPSEADHEQSLVPSEPSGRVSAPGAPTRERQCTLANSEIGLTGVP